MIAQTKIYFRYNDYVEWFYCSLIIWLLIKDYTFFSLISDLGNSCAQSLSDDKGNGFLYADEYLPTSPIKMAVE